MGKDMHFNANKIFVWLFILTAVEVLWGLAFGQWWEAGKIILWGGLIGMALVKAYLIAVYFMHLKFEGWIIWGLLIPTPFLVLVIFGYVMPDVANKHGNLVHPVGIMYDKELGAVVDKHQQGGHGSEEHGGDASEH